MLVREEDWERLRIPANRTRKLGLKHNKTLFKTYGTGLRLAVVGRTKCLLQADRQGRAFVR